MNLRDKIHHTPGRKPDGGVDSSIELYDTDILAIESVLARLNTEEVGRTRDLETFVQKTTELFAEIGLKVDVSMWTSTADGVYIPQITINGRIDTKHEFDYDRMVHEVTNDVLQLGEGGVISTKKMNPSAPIFGGHGNG